MRLNTQVSEYDCGPICLLNSLSFLYKRDEIPVKLIKIIYLNTLDAKNKVIGDCGTSKGAMKRICNKFNIYGLKHNMDINYMYYAKNEVNFGKIVNCINNNGVVIVRSKLDVDHYYLITNIDEDYVYIWDPYKTDASYDTYNLKIEINDIDNTKDIDYSLGPIERREIILASRYC